MSGVTLYQDYGISFDEKFHRTNASFWYKYAKDFLLDPNSSNVLNSEKLIKQKNHIRFLMILNIYLQMKKIERIFLRQQKK